MQRGSRIPPVAATLAGLALIACGGADSAAPSSSGHGSGSSTGESVGAGASTTASDAATSGDTVGSGGSIAPGTGGATASSSTATGTGGGATCAGGDVPCPTGCCTPSVVIGAGWDHTCALVGGVVSCWGELSTTTSSLSPVVRSGLGSVAKLGSGGEDDCAIEQSGALLCWGDNDYGEVGDGTTVPRNVPTPVVAIPSSLSKTEVSTSGADTCAVTDDQRVWCWGSFTSPTPAPIDGLPPSVAVGVAYYFFCALAVDGVPWCWGFPEGLGDGSTQERWTPGPVPGLPTIASIGVGVADHACAVSTAGAVYCWGSNDHGQVGNGTASGSGFVATPALVGGLPPIAMVTGGSSHTCAIDTNGSLWCWGDNRKGQLGNGTTIDSAKPISVSLPTPVVGVAAGAEHTCVINAGGKIWCWGGNPYGQLGTGSAATSAVPVGVSGF